MSRRDQATANRYEAAAQRLAKGESAADVYRALYPRSRCWKTQSLYAEASKLTHKVSLRVQELLKKAEADTIIDIKKRKQILSDIASAKPGDFMETTKTGGVKIKFEKDSLKQCAVQTLKAHEEKKDNGIVTVTEIRLRDPIAAIAELNKMEGVYRQDQIEGDITHLMVMREPDPAPKRQLQTTPLRETASAGAQGAMVDKSAGQANDGWQTG